MFRLNCKINDKQHRGVRRPYKMDGPSSSKMGPKQQASGSHNVEDIKIDNSETVLAKIANLYAERLMSDICLVVGGKEFPAHRLILCASSEVFQVMLMNPHWTEFKETRVQLQETPACMAVFEDFLRYLYTGQIHVNHSAVLPLLELADKYNVKDLISLCVNYMCKHIAFAAANNLLISWMQYTLTCSHHRVAESCQNFIKWNLEKISETADFGNCEVDVLVSFLQQNDLVVHDELRLYSCVEHWLQAQYNRLGNFGESEREAHMEALVVEVISHIRFAMMTPRQLADLLLSPLTKMYKEFFVERMAIGMAFQTGQMNRVHEVIESEENGAVLFTPRLYTSETWSAQLAVDNFFNLPVYHTRTLVFSSPTSLEECRGDRTCEWIVDVWPRGVWFKKCHLIVWQGTVEVPEAVFRTVRLSITCKDPPCRELRVKVGVLIYGVQDGIEHVMTVMQRNFFFGGCDKVLNLDDLLSFDELNNPVPRSPYLVGKNRDSLKLQIVIAPLRDNNGNDPVESE